MYLEQVNVGNHMRKRLFIGLLAVSFIFLFAIFSLAWWIVARRGLLINKVILTLLTAAVIAVFVLLALGLAALVWSLWYSKKTIPSLQSAMVTATSVLFPLALQLGKWLGVSEERIKNSFIQVSNHLVRTRVREKHLKKVIILAPHCLQWIHCPHKITINVNNCKECGRCPIAALIKLARKYEVDLLVVTGGTFARKVIKENRPEAVVAIACERDLTSGIQDVVGLPVLGVVNERPEGPCSNTRVNLNKVEEAILYFKQGG